MQPLIQPSNSGPSPPPISLDVPKIFSVQPLPRLFNRLTGRSLTGPGFTGSDPIAQRPSQLHIVRVCVLNHDRRGWRFGWQWQVAASQRLVGISQLLPVDPDLECLGLEMFRPNDDPQFIN